MEWSCSKLYFIAIRKTTTLSEHYCLRNKLLQYAGVIDRNHFLWVLHSTKLQVTAMLWCKLGHTTTSWYKHNTIIHISKTTLDCNDFTLVSAEVPAKLANSHYLSLQVKIWNTTFCRPAWEEAASGHALLKYCHPLLCAQGAEMSRELPSPISDKAQALVVTMPVLDPKAFAEFWTGNYAFTKDSLHLAHYTYIQF